MNPESASIADSLNKKVTPKSIGSKTVSVPDFSGLTAAIRSVTATGIATAGISEKPATASVSKKKSSATGDSLAGFREFAAIAGSVASPTRGADVVSAADTKLGPVKTVSVPEPVIGIPAPSLSPTSAPSVIQASGTVVAREKHAKVAHVFGLGWIPYASDLMALVLLGASAHQVYEAISNRSALNVAVPSIVLLAAAGVVMLAVSLMVRLLSQIAVTIGRRNE
jgi:hypothetical protein